MNYPAESFAILAMLINFISYRQNDINQYRLLSDLAMVCLGTHFLLLEALAAAIGCYLAFARNIISILSQHKAIVIFFVMLNVLFLLFEWFVLNNGPIILFAYSASIIFTLGTFLLSSATNIRKYFLVAEVLNITYAILVGSIMGTVGIAINIASILIKLIQQQLSIKHAADGQA